MKQSANPLEAYTASFQSRRFPGRLCGRGEGVHLNKPAAVKAMSVRPGVLVFETVRFLGSRIMCFSMIIPAPQSILLIGPNEPKLMTGSRWKVHRDKHLRLHGLDFACLLRASFVKLRPQVASSFFGSARGSVIVWVGDRFLSQFTGHR
jgi:hypothetical protein